MPHEVETMAYRKEGEHSVPWHGLGYAIEHDATPEEMLKAAGLNWTVSKRPLWTPATSVGVESPDIGSILEGSLIKVPDHFALVRDSDNKVLGPAGKDYIPTQNRQAFDFFKKFTDAGEMRMETAGSLQGGKQVWVLAKLLWKFTLPGGDIVMSYLLMSSPHVWGKSFVMKFVTVRVVCNNTFVMAMNESTAQKGFRMPHIRAFDSEVYAEAAQTLGIARELFDDFNKKAEIMARATVDQQVVIRYIADIFQPELMTEQFGKAYGAATEITRSKLILDPDSPKVDPINFKRTAFDVFNSINRQPGADLKSANGTMWGAFNAVTYYMDHTAGRDRDNALHAAWFGQKAVLKTAAYGSAARIATLALTT